MNEGNMIDASYSFENKTLKIKHPNGDTEKYEGEEAIEKFNEINKGE